LVVGESVGDWIGFQVELGKARHAAQVLKLVCIAYIVAFHVQNLKVAGHTNIEHVVYAVVRKVELLKLLKSLNALDLFEFAASNLEDAHIFEGGAQVTEAANHRVIQTEVLQRWQDFTGDLQTVTGGVDSQLESFEQGKFTNVDAT